MLDVTSAQKAIRTTGARTFCFLLRTSPRNDHAYITGCTNTWAAFMLIQSHQAEGKLVHICSMLNSSDRQNTCAYNDAFRKFASEDEKKPLKCLCNYSLGSLNSYGAAAFFPLLPQ